MLSKRWAGWRDALAIIEPATVVRWHLVAIDFFVVPTATFRILFGFIVLAHDRRRVVHFNLTAHPTAE